MTGIVSLGGSSTPGGSTTQLQYNNSGAFAGLSSLTTDGTNLTLTSASFGLSGNITGAGIIGTSGIRYKNSAATLTDTTSTGTVATGYTDIWGGNIIAASAATTVTNYYGSYFKVPIAGTNVTLTNKVALGADSISIGGAAQGTNALAVTGTSALNFGTLGAGSTASGLSVIGTFNDAGTAFNGALLINVTNTASNGNSLLFDLQASAVSKFKVQTNGQITSAAGATLGGTLDVTNNQIRTVGSLNLGSGNTGILTSPGAGSVQLGAADVDTGSTAQTFRTQGALAGGTSNVAGANWTFIASPGKGTGAGGSFIFQTAPAGSTGTAVNAPVTVLTLDSTQLATFAGAMSSVGSHTFTTATSGIVLKRGANGLCGTFVANGVTPVTVSNTNVAVTDCIIISLNTVGGTVGASAPDIKTITAGVGFTVAGVSLDTSTYNYAIIKNAA